MATSCPVSTLPVEMLGRIFTFLPNCYEDPPKHNANPPSWLAVTHVCQRWRFASLSYVDLWTNIITNPLVWTKESLRRSGSAPITLKVKLESFSGPIPNAVSEVLSNYPRARRIDLEGTSISRLICHIPVQPALSSDTLSLKERSPRFNMMPDLSFLHEDMPKLTGLLDCIQFQWSSPGNTFKRTLTELSLALGGIPSDFRPNDTELRDILSGLPVLQHLFLAHVFRQKTNATRTVHDIAASPDHSYPRLTHLTSIGDSSPDLSLFACSLRIPESKALTFAYMHNTGAMNMTNAVPHSTHLLSLGVTTLLVQSTPFMQDSHPMVKEPGIRIHDTLDGWSICFTSLVPDAPDEEDDDDEEVRVREVPFLQVCVDTRLPAPSSGPSAHSEIVSSLVLNIFAMAQRLGWHPEKITIKSSLFNQQDMWRSAFSPLSGLQDTWGFTLSSPFA